MSIAHAHELPPSVAVFFLGLAHGGTQRREVARHHRRRRRWRKRGRPRLVVPRAWVLPAAAAARLAARRAGVHGAAELEVGTEEDVVGGVLGVGQTGPRLAQLPLARHGHLPRGADFMHTLNIGGRP